MAAKKKRSKSRSIESETPRIHEAFLESGSSGAVICGQELELSQAVARRQGGQDVVVCGPSTKANRGLACRIESAVGPCERQEPHVDLAGPLALPHFQQTERSAKGHSFYETENRTAKKSQ